MTEGKGPILDSVRGLGYLCSSGRVSQQQIEINKSGLCREGQKY